jgi:hypothetical protein
MQCSSQRGWGAQPNNPVWHKWRNALRAASFSFLHVSRDHYMLKNTINLGKLSSLNRKPQVHYIFLAPTIY